MNDPIEFWAHFTQSADRLHRARTNFSNSIRSIPMWKCRRKSCTYYFYCVLYHWLLPSLWYLRFSFCRFGTFFGLITGCNCIVHGNWDERENFHERKFVFNAAAKFNRTLNRIHIVERGQIMLGAWILKIMRDWINFMLLSCLVFIRHCSLNSATSRMSHTTTM